MKKLNNEERYALAAKLESILGTDLDPDEETALEQAIEIISPEYAAARARREQESAAWFDVQTPESLAAYIAEQNRNYPPPSPDASGTSAVIPFHQAERKTSSCQSERKISSCHAERSASESKNPSILRFEEGKK